MASMSSFITICFLLLALIFAIMITATPPSLSPTTSSSSHNYYDDFKFNSPLIILVCIIVSFGIGFIIYVRCMKPAYHIDETPLSIIGRPPFLPQRYGLNSTIITTFPVFNYSDVVNENIGIIECGVCLKELKDEEILRLIPKCCHVFHRTCIDTFLSGCTLCPVCRVNLQIKLPVSSQKISLGESSRIVNIQQEAGGDGGGGDERFTLRLSDDEVQRIVDLHWSRT